MGEVMWAELREKQTWKRDTMPYAGAARSYMMQTHQIHYYDELLQDMGAPACRKRGWFASVRECFEPYRPRDYDTIVTGTFKSEKAASKSTSCFGVIQFIKSLFQMKGCLGVLQFIKSLFQMKDGKQREECSLSETYVKAESEVREEK